MPRGGNPLSVRDRRRPVILALALVSLAPSWPALADHVHEPPHGGALQVLGDEAAHVELVLERGAGRLTAYLLDGEAERAVRIAAPVLELRVDRIDGADASPAVRPFVLSLAAVANVLTGETVGDTSQFEVTDARLAGVKRLAGEIPAITVRGMRFERVRLLVPEGNETLPGGLEAGKEMP